MKYLSNTEIEQAKKATNYIDTKPYHQHHDCIRIAYHWLDAQQKTMHPNKRAAYEIKHLIEAWAGRYVSQSDVEVAATMHPDIEGEYPYFNISSRLTEPIVSRLEDIPEAFTHDNYCSMRNSAIYKQAEGSNRPGFLKHIAKEKATEKPSKT